MISTRYNLENLAYVSNNWACYLELAWLYHIRGVGLFGWATRGVQGIRPRSWWRVCVWINHHQSKLNNKDVPDVFYLFIYVTVHISRLVFVSSTFLQLISWVACVDFCVMVQHAIIIFNLVITHVQCTSTIMYIKLRILKVNSDGLLLLTLGFFWHISSPSTSI